MYQRGLSKTKQRKPTKTPKMLTNAEDYIRSLSTEQLNNVTSFLHLPWERRGGPKDMSDLLVEFQSDPAIFRRKQEDDMKEKLQAKKKLQTNSEQHQKVILCGTSYIHNAGPGVSDCRLLFL